MASLVLSGNTSGSITISSPSVSGTNTLTLPASTGTIARTAAPIFTGQAMIPMTVLIHSLPVFLQPHKLPLQPEELTAKPKVLAYPTKLTSLAMVT
jgi:hypothetical protein